MEQALTTIHLGLTSFILIVIYAAIGAAFVLYRFIKALREAIKKAEGE